MKLSMPTHEQVQAIAANAENALGGSRMANKMIIENAIQRSLRLVTDQLMSTVELEFVKEVK